MMEDKQQKLERFKRDISKDADSSVEQRDAANEDMRFISVDGGQWEGFLENQYTNDRVRAEFDIVSGYKNRTLAEWNANRVGVEYIPDDAATTDDDAELLTSMYRADHRDGGGKRAVKNAVNEALTCGFGAWHLRPVYEDEGDPENDAMRIIWEPINNAFNTVYFDRASRQMGKQDARHVTLLTPYTEDSFKEQWPDANPVSAYSPDDRSYLNYSLNGERFIFVATRYEVVKVREWIYVYNNLQARKVEVFSEADHEKREEELRSDEFREFVRKRRVTQRRVEMSRFSGDAFLEEPRRIAGKHLGVIPVYAYWEHVDGQERYYGLVRKLKDAGRVMNVTVSQLIETAASGGDRVPIFDPEQMDDPKIRDDWADRTNKAFLMARALRDADGNIVSAGPIGYVEPPTIGQASAALMEVVGTFIRDTTGGAPQETLNPDASGKAITAVHKRVDQNTAPIFDNIADAVEWDGVVYQSLASETYADPSQIVRTMSLDGSRDRKSLFEARLDPETGLVTESTTLQGKRFLAHSDVGPQYETVREQTVETLKGMLEPLSMIEEGKPYIKAIVDTIIQNVPGVGLGGIKQLSRQSMLLAGLEKPASEEDEEFLANAAQNQSDPQAEFIRASVEQALAEARNLDAASAEKAANAELKVAQTRKTEAETAETLASIEMNQARTLADIRKQVLGQAARGF